MADTHRSVFGLQLSSPSLGNVKLKDVDEVSINRKTTLKQVVTMSAEGIAQGFQSGPALFDGSMKTFVRQPKPEVDWVQLWKSKEQFDILFREGTPESPGRRGRWKGCRISDVSDNGNANADSAQTLTLMILDEVFE